MYLLFNARITNDITYKYNDVKWYSKLTWNHVKETKLYDCVIFVFCIPVYNSNFNVKLQHEWKKHKKYGEEYGAWKILIYKGIGMRIFSIYFFII